MATKCARVMTYPMWTVPRRLASFKKCLIWTMKLSLCGAREESFWVTSHLKASAVLADIKNAGRLNYNRCLALAEKKKNQRSRVSKLARICLCSWPSVICARLLPLSLLTEAFFFFFSWCFFCFLPPSSSLEIVGDCKKLHECLLKAMNIPRYL